MAAAVHSWTDTLTVGLAYEDELDSFFGRWYQIVHADQVQQCAGIDRVFTSTDGRVFTVEYKTDTRTAETGNVFVETVSVDTEGVPGWAYTTQAHVLAYFTPQDRTVYLVSTFALKQALPEWRRHYPEVPAVSGSKRGGVYRSCGLLVPVEVFARLCHRCERLPG